MGESKQKFQKPRKQRKPEPIKQKLTPEQEAALAIASEKAQAEAKAEQERVELYGKSVKHMSHRQLRKELTRTIKREHFGRPPQPIAGLTVAYATVLLAILDSTQTSPVFEADKEGRPTRVARLDQINQLGRLHPYPR